MGFFTVFSEKSIMSAMDLVPQPAAKRRRTCLNLAILIFLLGIMVFVLQSAAARGVFMYVKRECSRTVADFFVKRIH